MATNAQIRALNRSARVRIKDSLGHVSVPTSTKAVVVDLDDTGVRKSLGHHSAIGQFVVQPMGAVLGSLSSASLQGKSLAPADQAAASAVTSFSATDAQTRQIGQNYSFAGPYTIPSGTPFQYSISGFMSNNATDSLWCGVMIAFAQNTPAGAVTPNWGLNQSSSGGGNSAVLSSISTSIHPATITVYPVAFSAAWNGSAITGVPTHPTQDIIQSLNFAVWTFTH